MLTWNNDTKHYEANYEGQHVEVDGDVFAETEQEMVKNGMTEQEAFDELTDPVAWVGCLPMDGVYVNGKYQG